ncbi:MAG: heavy metal translocating P-type ATPase [Coriobacteriales bacterium]
MELLRQAKTQRLIAALVIFFAIMLLPLDSWLENPYNVYTEFCLFLIPYVLAGYPVFAKAARNLARGNALDENFLMVVASAGAFLMVFFPQSQPHMAEGAAVMLFFQVGELFEDYAVGKSRRSVKEMMDIAPEYANLLRDGQPQQVDPYEVEVGSLVLVRPGERVPLDGTVVEGSTSIDSSALTGESLPVEAGPGDQLVSGCINLSSAVTLQVTKAYEDSTVSKILEMVESAAEKKASTESFITCFARVYTPVVVGAAAILAVVPPLLGFGAWSDWIFRALTFLVVSCPCALVISVPMSYFGGIGGASRLGILVKGSNYLEVLARVDTVVFDKTGTLTTGRFGVSSVSCEPGVERQELLELAAHAEQHSTHPLALSVVEAWGGTPDARRVSDLHEHAGKGIEAHVDGRQVLVGNAALMEAFNLRFTPSQEQGTVLYVAVEGRFAGFLAVRDQVKPGAAEAVRELGRVGVHKTVMLTGDSQAAAAQVAGELGLSEFRAQLLPQDKVSQVESLLAGRQGRGSLAFVGDGINDAPVLTRADVGIAMGALGSDAAIEAADVVLMDDDPRGIARAVRLARKTHGIVWQNIVFAIGVKLLILVLAAAGVATMWLAVFGDVGVAALAILNAMRAMSVGKLR